MASFTTLVNIDTEAAHKLTLFVSQLIPATEGQQFYNDCKTLIESLNTAELINKILKHTPDILELEDELAVDGCFQSLFTIIYTLGDNNDEVAIVKSVVASLTAEESKSRLRLKALITLFNLVFSGESKFEAMNAIFNFGRVTKQTKLIAHFYSKYEEWAATWGISADLQRVLLKSIAQALEANGQHSQALSALIRYFKSFAGAKYPADVESLITNAVLHAIRSPLAAFEDRSALLETFNGQTFPAPLSTLVSLLRIICDGSLDEFSAFQSANASVLAAHNLDGAALERNVKLLTLCSLAAQAADKTLTFEAIRVALKVEEADVEVWTIDAISEGLLEASIDQLTSTVTISRYAHRSFGPAHWKAIQAKLRALRKNMAVVTESLHRNKTPAAVASN